MKDSGKPPPYRRSGPHNNEEEEEGGNREDDRKPPAREISIHTTPSTTTHRDNAECDSSVDDSALTPAYAAIPTRMHTSASTPQPLLLASTPGESPDTDDRKQRPLHSSDFHKPIRNNNNSVDTESSTPLRSRTWLNHELYFWSGASLLSVLQLLYLCLPLTALWTLLVLVISTLLFAWTALQRLRLEYRERITQHGLAAYLPESLSHTLTSQTLHEYLTDDSFGLEYRHLLLYFMPGLSNEQIEQYVDQLPPRHREELRRHGMGYFFGDGFMRLLMGEHAYRARQQQQQQQGAAAPTSLSDFPTTLSVATTPTEATDTSRRRLSYQRDDSTASSNSDLGLQISTGDLAGGHMNDAQAWSMAQWLGVRSPSSTMTPPTRSNTTSTTRGEATTATGTTSSPAAILDESNPEDDDRRLRREYADEERILTDAFWDAYRSLYASVWTPTVQTVRERITQPVTNMVVRIGLGALTLSSGIGVVGYWQGVYALPFRQTFPSSRHHGSARNHDSLGLALVQTPWDRLQFPSSESLWTTAVMGGASAGVVLFARAYWSIGRNTESTARKGAGSENEPKQQREN
jgi:hypothetical protein